MQRYTPFFWIILCCFLPAMTGAQIDAPVGWASQNGGTTGGAGGETVTVNTRNEFLSYVSSSAPYIIQIQDTITLNPYERVAISSNKTVIGRGTQATICGGGLEIKGDNVIIRNIRITGSYDGDWDGKTHSTDALTIYGRNVWVDHCDLSASADGLLDIRADGSRAADFVTVSWTRFSNHNKVMLFGAADDEIADRGHLRTTIHHCWFDGFPGRGVNQRMPRVRFGDVHIFNSFFDEVDSYCVAARLESDVVVENNYFRNSKNPHDLADQGLGLEDPDLAARGNIYDAATGARKSGGDAFNPADFYSYALDDAAALPAAIMNGAGLFDDPDNRPPLALPDTIFREPGAGQTFIIDPLTNDADSDGGDLRLASVLRVVRGSGRILKNTIAYVAPAGQSGTDTLFYQLVDTQGGVDTGVVIIDFSTTTAMETLAGTPPAMSVQPNPVTDEALITCSPTGAGPIHLLVYDLMGRACPAAVRKLTGGGANGSTKFLVQAQALATGTYVVVIREGERIYTQKMVVIHQ